MVERTGLHVAPLPGSPPQGTSPTDGRLVLGGLFGTGGGCIAGGGFSLSATQMQVAVSQSVWRIPDPTNSSAVFLSPADTANLFFSAGPASGSRKDVLWVRQNNYESGDPHSRLSYGVTAGVAAAFPTETGVPSGSMRIGVLTVPAGATNAAACTFVAAYPVTVASPSLRAATKAQLDAVSGAYYGQRAISGSIDYRWNGASWFPFDSDWSSYIPNYLNVALAGTAFWRYRGGEVEVRGNGTIGNPNTSGPFGRVKMSLPMPGQFYSGRDVAGTLSFTKSGENDYDGRIQQDGDPNNVFLDATVAVNRNGFQVLNGLSIGPSVPFTWAAGDKVQYRFTYSPSL